MAFQSEVDIAIPAWRNVKDGDGSQYTVYCIEVSHDCKKWVVERRFKECQTLNGQLAKEPGFNADAFPSTPLITLNKFATALLEERRVALQRYFKGISHMILGHKLLIQFFGVGDASIPFIPTYTRAIFIPTIWPPEGLKNVPPEYNINGQFVLLKGLAGTICTLVQTLQNIEHDIYKKPDLAQRIAVLDQTSDKRSQAVGELIVSLETLVELLDLDAGLVQTRSAQRLFTPPIENTLKHIVKVGKNAQNWASNIDEQLLSGLDDPQRPIGRPGGNHPAATTSTPVGSVGDMEKLRQRAEVSLALLVASQSPEERKDAVVAIDELIGILHKQIELTEIRNDHAKSAELRTLKDFVLQGKANQLTDAGNLVSQSDVVAFEEQLFSFLDVLSKLDSMPKIVQFFDPATGQVQILSTLSIAPNTSDPAHAAQQAQQQLAESPFPGKTQLDVATSLFRSTEELRTQLAKARISLEQHRQKHPEDRSSQNLIDRITDIQEHLVEVQYQVKTKYMPIVAQPPVQVPMMSANILPAQEVAQPVYHHNAVHVGQPSLTMQPQMQPPIYQANQPVYQPPQPNYHAPPQHTGHPVYRRPLDDEFEL